MSDLNLNFDTGSKNISMSNSTGDGILNIQHNTTPENSPKKIITEVPNLNVSDPVGMSILANTPTPVQEKSTPRSRRLVKRRSLVFLNQQKIKVA